MPSPSVDMMWQEIRMLKTRVCALEDCCAVMGSVSGGGDAAMLQFKVGEPPSSAYYTKNITSVILPSNNSYILTIKDYAIRQDSVDVYWDGGIMAKGRLDRESYNVLYYTDRIEITRIAGYPFVTGQFYIIKYVYTT